MKLEFSIVPHGQIASVLPGLMNNLRTSEMWTRGRASVDDIAAFLFSKQMLLWIAFDIESKTIHGHLITEIKQYPQSRWLVIQYIAAEPHTMAAVQEKVHPMLESYARDMGCYGIEAFGRPGWAPQLKQHGYKAPTICYEKILTGVQP